MGMQVATAQNADIEARKHYLEAEAAYKSKDYNKTISLLDTTVKTLKKANARIEALRLKAYTDMNDIDEAQKALDSFLGFTADYTLHQELQPYIKRMQQAEENRLAEALKTQEKEAALQDKALRMAVLLSEVMLQTEEGAFNKASNALAEAKKLSTGSSADKMSLEQTENYLNTTREESRLYKATLSGSVEDFRAYLKAFPNHKNAAAVQQKLIDFENSMYAQIVEIDNTSYYQKYINTFPNGTFIAEVRRRMELAEEREAYESFTTQKTAINAQEYLKKFPQGANRNAVLIDYEQLLYTEGVAYEDSKKYTLAQEYYGVYKSNFPNGANISSVTKNLNHVERKIRKDKNLNSIDDGVIFFVTFASNKAFGEIYGVSFDRLPKRKIGLYLSAQVNPPMFNLKEKNQTITQEELANSDLYEATFLSGSVGLNFRIVSTIWLSGGVAVSTQAYMHKDTKEGYILEGEKKSNFFPEFGLKAAITKNIYIRGIAQLNPRETVYQAGVGIKF